MRRVTVDMRQQFTDRGPAQSRTRGLRMLFTGAGALAAAPAMMEVAAECLDLRPYGGGLYCNDAPILEGDVVGGSPSAGLENLNTPAVVYPRAAHRAHSPGDCAVAF